MSRYFTVQDEVTYRHGCVNAEVFSRKRGGAKSRVTFRHTPLRNMGDVGIDK